ncbi:DUF2157 domain-containing protein [Nocardiopsis sp. MG754419]|uniref:DUF2157 domain-containing protein n=1 Tax=Nocardiopsis sp. MG754419 TaxID=2259865 RepID=UPI001BA61222|nr:DUF2157 domain-containing protein [Nocardiopsis sp. MG754419]MBR8744376.1 hypothetical protein [Nocardiopsis sp. MG754419]
MNAEGSPPRPGAPRRCPDCRSALAASVRSCHHCGLGLVGPTAQRLWWIDTELASLDRRRHALVEERPGVLARLRWETRVAAPATPTSAPAPPRGPEPPDAQGAPHSAVRAAQGRAEALGPPPPDLSAAPEAPVREMSRRSAQNVILGLGALLIGISALTFAVWTWGDLGTGARATVLGLTTVTFAGVALPLYRRGLRATAEAFGVVAAFLLGVDALALWLLVDAFTDGAGYAAAALVVIGALLTLYPSLVPLRAPRVLAAVIAQPVPFLVVAAVPGAHPAWALATVAATGLVGVGAVHLLGAPRPGVPVRTLHGAAVTVWSFALVVTALIVLFVDTAGDDPLNWWALATALFLCGVTGLLMARGRGGAPDRPTVYSVAGLAALALLPLAAGPSTLPTLPRVTVTPWSLTPADMSAPAVTLLGVEAGAVPPFGLIHLAGIVVSAALALGVVWLLRRRSLFVTAVLLAPATLLAFPLLLGLSQTVTVVWALLVGAALVMSAGVAPRGLSTVPVLVGFLTLLTGTTWALPERYTTLAALLLLTATALVAATVARRFATPGPRPEPGGRVAGLYMAAMLTWAPALLIGAVYVIVGRIVPGTDGSQWWLVSVMVLLAAATALTLSRIPTPSSLPAPTTPGARDRRVDLRAPWAWAGVLLLPAAPLAVAPTGAPGPTPFPTGYALWSASPDVLREPASAVLGLPAPPEPLVGVLSAFGVLILGAVAMALVVLIERRWAVAGAALVVPPTLVPLPVLFGAPFAVAVVWTLLVGAALLLSVSRLDAPRFAWLPGVSGLGTLLLGLAWSSVEQHALLSALVLLAAVTVVSALSSRRTFADDTVAAVVYGLTVSAWGVSTVLWALSLSATATLAGGALGTWWLLGATTLLLGATALLLHGGASRLIGPGALAPAPRGSGTGPFAIVGLLLLTALPLVVGPARSPVLALFAGSRLWAEASPTSLGEPAHVFVGLSGATEAGPAVALGVLVAGALAVGTVWSAFPRLLVPGAALLAPVTLVPLPFTLGAPFVVALVWTVLVASVLTAGAGPVRRRGASWVPWSAGLYTFVLAFGWALSEPYATAGVLLAWAVATSFAAALARTRPIALASTASTTFGTGAFALALLSALGVPPEYAAFGPLVVVAAVAIAAPRLRSPLVESAEIPAAVWAVLALVLTVTAGGRPELVAVALAVVGVIALACAVRPGRWWLAVVGGLLMFCALWTVLAAWDVSVPEAYTVPPALAFVVIGWEWARRATTPPSSWLTHAGGLALLLGPTVWLALDDQDMGWRVPAALVAGLVAVLWGVRARAQAPLILGGAALVLVSLRAFGPPLWDLTTLLPNWVPFAVVGLLLLLVGARYEANLVRLRRVGRYVGSLR